MRPNPPRVITVVLAVGLLIVGLALVFFQASAIDLIKTVGLPKDIQSQLVSSMGDRIVAWVALAAAPILLIIGSLAPGI